MKESRSVSTEVSAEISAAFWGVTATMGISKTTGYNWEITDSSTKSEANSFTVQVIVSPGKKVQIQEAVGVCGDSTVHTQMFRLQS